MPSHGPDEVISALAIRLASETEGDFCNVIRTSGIKSPIEIMMAAALYFCQRSCQFYGNEFYTFRFDNASDNPERYESPSELNCDCYIYIRPQMPIGKYVADFLVEFKNWSNGGIALGVIECDGHDFHERTKEQAAHDRRRDRYFQAKGFLIMRYTGSEIYADPVACASEALKMLELRAHENGDQAAVG